MTDPDPGTDEAVARGCTCDYRDGEPEDNDRWPDWITTGCPIHDSTPRRPGGCTGCGGCGRCGKAE